MTPEQFAKNEFRVDGASVASWAIKHGFSPALVYAVLSGRRKCLRGKSHEIAIALGLKVARDHLSKEKKMD